MKVPVPTKKAKKGAEQETDAPGDAECLYCHQLFSITGGNWMRCEGCRNWAHADCTDGQTKDGQAFYCELCVD